MYDKVLERAMTDPVTIAGSDAIRGIVRNYVMEELLLGAQQEIADDESLLDNGVLDSTGAVEMVAFLEKTFGVKIDDHEIGPDNLETIDRICAMIVRKTGGSHPA